MACAQPNSYRYFACYETYITPLPVILKNILNMKKHIILLFSCLFSIYSFAQETTEIKGYSQLVCSQRNGLT